MSSLSDIDSRGVKWMGLIPHRWSKHAVKRHYDIQLGKMLQNGPDSENDVLVPYAKALHVLWGRVNAEDLPVMWASPSEINQYGIKGGDLLVCEGGEVGRAGIVTFPPDKCIIQNALHRVRPRKFSGIHFLQYVLEAVSNAGWLEVLCNRATISHFTREKFAHLRIPIPPEDEQVAIANFLDRATERIDTLIAKKERQIDLLQEKRAALISHAVTKGLKPKANMKDSGIEWLGEIPEHWLLSPLRRVVQQFVDYRGSTPEKVDTGVRLITAKNIKAGQIDFSLSEEYMREDQYAEWMIRGWPVVGDVLVTTEAPLGEVAQISEPTIALAQRVILLKVNKTIATNEFVKYHFMSDFGQGELRSRATGSTALGIKADRLKETMVALPPLPEQVVITRFLDKQSEFLQKPSVAIWDSVEKLREYRTALISAAVTGKIDVREEVV